MSIKIKLIVMFLTIATVPLVLVVALAFHNYKDTIEANHLSQLQDITAYKADKIETYFKGIKSNIEISQGFYNTKKNLPVLLRFSDDPNNPEFQASTKQLGGQLQQMQSVLTDVTDIMLVNPEGKVVYANKSGHFSKDLSRGPSDVERKAFEEGKSKICLSDIYFDKAEDNRYEMLITAPALDFNGVTIGVIVFEVNMTTLYKFVQDATGLGETGETLIGKKIGNQVLFLNPLRHDPNAALTRTANIGDNTGVGLQNAVQGTGAGQYIDYRGKKVVGAWRYIPSLDWGMVAKIDADEAFADVVNLRNLMAIILGIVIILSGITAFSIAQSISEPIKRLSEGAIIVGSGKLDYKLGTNQRDEIGQLSRTFDKMTSDLRQTLASRDELNREIEERKKVEEALRNTLSEKQFLADVVERSSQAFGVGYPDGRLGMVNIAFEQLTGYTADELRSIDWAKTLTPPEWLEIEQKKLEELHRTGKPVRYEKEYIRKDGRRVPIELLVHFIKDAEGKPQYYYSFITDITERKLIEEELRQSHDELEARVEERTADLDEAVKSLQKQVEIRLKAEETAKAERQRLNDVLETLPNYVCLLTDDYYMPFANRVFRETFGYQPEKKCYEFLFNRKEPCEDCQTYQVLKTGKPQRWEWTGPNGHNYDIYDYPFTDTDGSHLILEMGVDITEQKKAEKAVRQGEQRYRSLTEATTQVVWTTDAQGQVAGDMPLWREFTGQTFEEIQGWGWINSLHPDDRERTTKIWTQSIKNKSSYQTEYRMRRKDGKYRYVSVRGVPVLEPDGSIREWIGTCTDITEQKQAQDQLRAASLYARGLLEASLDPLVTISPYGKITDVNEATEQATGLPRKQLIGSSFSNYFTDSEKANAGYRKVISEGFVKDYPLTIRNVAGTKIDVLYNATLYKNEAGQVAGIFAAARDITQRKAAQEKQDVTNSLLELFVRKGSRKAYLDSTVEVIRNWSGCEFVGIRIKDSAGNIPYESYVGFDNDFLSKENALHLGSDNCLCIRAILENPQKQEMHIRSQGGSFYCNNSMAFLNGLSQNQKKEYRGHCITKGFKSIAIVPVRFGGEVYGAIHITDYKQGMVPLEKIQFIETTISPLVGEAIHRFNAEAELGKYRLHLEDLVKDRTEELSRSNRDLEQFAYVASHDLQEPLRAVAGFTELLRRKLKESLDSKTTEYMDFSIDGVKRMQTLISGLLEYSRVGTQGKQPEQTDSRAALDTAISHLQTSIKESGVKINVEKLPMIHYDSLQLAQLFQNLIGNAIKFRGNEPPVINISAIQVDGSWRFAIADNGIGIDQQYVEKIFLIFQRLHSREQYPGTGIGLSICKKIVERHGGRIWVESQPGKGATFYFTAH